jgi:sec-independent protein translocase protein TatA
MIGNIGPLEIGVVLVVALLVFGPKRLPELGRSAGKGISEFKSGINSIHEGTSLEEKGASAVETSASTEETPVKG